MAQGRGGLDDVTDADLLGRHVDGDADAFGELVRRHRDRLWAVAIRTLGDRSEAEDAVQEALLSAYRRADSFRGESAVTTWLHRIVVNACLDRARRRAARPTDPMPDHDLPVPGDDYAATDTALAVQAALSTLPFEQRAALVLVDMAGWPVEEAARILDVPTGTVKSRCSRGRARLLPLVRGLREGNQPPPGAVPASSEGGEPRS